MARRSPERIWRNRVEDQFDRAALMALLGVPTRPVASHPKEADFQRWMQEQRIDPRELDVYDFRAAMMSGAQRDASGHWPSDFKRDNHPSLVVGGFNTKTGQRVPGAKLASGVQELIALGWEPATARQLWATVTTK